VPTKKIRETEQKKCEKESWKNKNRKNKSLKKKFFFFLINLKKILSVTKEISPYLGVPLSGEIKINHSI